MQGLGELEWTWDFTWDSKRFKFRTDKNQTMISVSSKKLNDSKVP